MADDIDVSDDLTRAVPKLMDLTMDVLFKDVWERKQLSKRDRSLATISSLIASYRPLQLPYHIKFAVQNGLSREEITETITHLAFYAGWPAAISAADIAVEVFKEMDSSVG